MSIATSVPSTNTCGLLGPSDPPLFSTVNSEGRSPALLVADHGGRCFPAALGRLGLEAGVLDRHGVELGEKGILDAPDYVVNAGGLINVYVEMEGYVRERALRMAEGIYANTERVINISREQGVTTAQAADRFAEERIELIGQIKKGFFGGI